MHVLSIIQARLESSRLPNKVLLELPPNSGVTVLERVVNAATGAEMVDEVILVMPRSDRKAKLPAISFGAKICWGSDHRDLLDDFHWIAEHCKADVIVRITADCPLLSSKIIDDVVKKFLDSDVEFMYNTASDDKPYIDGFDVEVFTKVALERAYKKSQAERQHVTMRFRTGDYKTKRAETPEGEFCSLDSSADYENICRIFNS